MTLQEKLNQLDDALDFLIIALKIGFNPAINELIDIPAKEFSLISNKPISENIVNIGFLGSYRENVLDKLINITEAIGFETSAVNGLSPLLEAIARGQDELIDKLLAAGAKLN